MSLETDLVAVLETICPGKVFPDVAPFGAARPYVTWQQIGGQALAYVEDPPPTKRHARVQVSVWASKRLEATALMLAIEAALNAATTFQARAESAHIGLHDDDTNLRGCSQDFSILGAR